MIEQADLDAAVTEGLLTSEQRATLLDFARRRHQLALGADEEHFRFITSFNDIFVTVAVVLVLAAVAMLSEITLGLLGPTGMWGAAGVAAVSWALAEYFTRARRMALPSIVLLLAFAGGVFMATSGAAYGLLPRNIASSSVVMIIASIVTVIAAIAHWRRFHVPITVAAGAAALVSLLAGLVAIGLQMSLPRSYADDVSETVMLTTIGLSGLGVFALAMVYDMADRERVTRRTDVAFWLHLLAAPLIVHPLFASLGLFEEGPMSIGKTMLVMLIYLALAIVALAVDRRALLVSALAYVIYAISTLFQKGAPFGVSLAFTFLILGSFLVMLSAGWPRIRARVVSHLPAAWAARLPALA